MDTTHPQSNDSTLSNTVTIIKSREEFLKALPEYMTHPDCRRWLLHIDKVPYYASGNKRYGTLDSPKDIEQLVNFDEAYAVFSAGGYTGLGFALGSDNKGCHWQGIDLDDIWYKSELNTVKLPGYIESSPSGNGLHAIGYGQAFRSLGSNSTGIEAYSHGRYFTVTGNAFNELLGLEVPIQPICLANYVEQVLRPLHGTKVTQSTGLALNASKSMMILSPEQMEDLRSALFSMPADERALWIAMGQALCRVKGGYELWAEWSATSVKHQGDSDLARWDGFSGDNTNYKAVFKRAQENGWVNPRKHQLMDSEKIFGNQPQFISPLPPPPPIRNFGWLEINVADVLTNSPKPPQFLIEELLPADELTLLSAHGGTGKSMLALQAAVCLAAGKSFMNKKVMYSRVLFYSGEDKTETIRHRFKQVCRQMQLVPKEVAPHIQFIDATEDPCLYQEIGPTAAYYELQARIQSFGASVVIIDNASDTFDGNENSRPQVRAFLRALKKLGTVLLLTHIDKNKAKGESNSEGYSGSTAWHNSARSRLFLTRNKTLELIHQKSNYGKLSEPILMTFSTDFVLIPLNVNPVNEEATLIKILFLIDKFDKRQDFISPLTNSPLRAFKKLSIDPLFPNSIYNDAQMFALTEHAEKEGLLEVIEFRDTNRNKKIKYQLTEKALALIPLELTHFTKRIEN